LYRKKYDKKWRMDLTADEMEDYKTKYPEFEKFELIDMNDHAERIACLVKQMLYFTDEELEDLGVDEENEEED
jgi:hypothetical protein